jgi:phosphatidylglycerol:prolipoprotein diacylglycerol transferase
MHPELNFILFKIQAYSFFTVAALAVAATGSYWYARKRGFKRGDCLWMILGTGLSVFIGARLFNILVNFDWYREEPARLFSLTAAGLSLYGGIIFAALTGFLISRLRKIPLMKFADTITPFIGVGIALMRVGCFLNGCCFGKVTDLPWGVKFPLLSPAHIHQVTENALRSLEVLPVHPTQIYELIAALIGSALAFNLIKKKKPDGVAALAAAVFFTAFRWFNMQLRALEYSDAVIHVWYPLFYGVIIVMCGYFLVRLRRVKRNVF